MQSGKSPCRAAGVLLFTVAMVVFGLVGSIEEVTAQMPVGPPGQGDTLSTLPGADRTTSGPTPTGLVDDAVGEYMLMSTDGTSSSNNSKAVALGYTVTTSSLASIVSSPVSYLKSFDVVWVNPNLDSSGYSTLRTGVAANGSLEQYVRDGGTLVICIAGNGGNQNDIAPGGVDYDRSTTHDSESITAPLHPYITGVGYGGASLTVSDFQSWGSTDHGQLQNLMGGTTIVLSNANGPSFVEYLYGGGLVVLNTLTYGWGSAGAKGVPQDNLIKYSAFAEGVTDEIIITPGQGLAGSGEVGGPFTPSSITYTLANSAGYAIPWMAGATQPWVTVNPAGGTLSAGGSTTVDVYLNAFAAALPVGTYTDTVTFTDVNDGNSQTRPVQLTARLHATKLVASDGTVDDEFGMRVCIDGDYAIVGAPYDDDKGSSSGSAYIFQRSGAGWVQQAKLTASDGTSSDYFGMSVSISGDYAIVGAYYDDDKGTDSGSAYIFQRSGASWTQQAKLTAADGASSDYFGYSVAIDGDYAIVGAYYDDDKGSNSGSAYIFQRSGASWTQQAKLTASDGAASDYFGRSVGIGGDYVIAGAYADDDKGSSSGSAYIFQRSGVSWTQQAKLTAADGASSDYFGYSVGISGDYAIAGAYADDDKGSSSGSAYIFQRSGASWSQQAKLTASDGAVSDYFGLSVAIDGNTAVVGAYYDDVNGTDSGSAYMFKRSGAGWTESKLTAWDGAASDYFGYDVSVCGEEAIVGAYGDDDKGSYSGSAYIFGNPDPLRVTAVMPPENYEPLGYEGGPFEPNYKEYELRNIGPNDVNWSADSDCAWLTIAPDSGLLPAGANQVATLLLDEVYAGQLEPNLYSCSIVFHNLDLGLSQARAATLTVKRIPGQVVITDSILPGDDYNMPYGKVVVGLSRTEQLTIANVDPTYEVIVDDISIAGGYREDFNDGFAQGWQEDVDADWTVASGEYKAYQPAPVSTDSMVATYSGKEWTDCYAQVRMRRSVSGYARYLLLRATSDFDQYPSYKGSTYGVGIDETSYYVFKMVNGAYTSLQGWTSSPYIQPPDQWNVLGFNLVGTQLQFYINGNLVWTGTDSSLAGGRVGLLGFTTTGDVTTHYFDDVVVTEPLTDSQQISAEQLWYNERSYEDSVVENAPDDWSPPPYPGDGIDPGAIQNVGLGGSEAFEILNAPNYPAVIPPSASLVLNIRFSPTAIDSYESVVTIESEDINGGVAEVNLSGAGIPDYLEVEPDVNVQFSGHPGGPFVPTYQYYDLANTGQTTLNWSVTADVGWLDILPASGSIGVDGSATVSVRTNAAAAALPLGMHRAKLTFRNAGTGKEHIRTVELRVYTEPKVWVEPTGFSVTVPSGQTTSAMMTIGNGGGSDLNFSLSAMQTGFYEPGAMIEQGGAGEGQVEVAAGAAFAPGRLLVRFEQAKERGVSAEAHIARHNQILAGLGLGRVKKASRLVAGLCSVELPAGAAVENAVAALKHTPGVIYAEPDYEVHIVGAPKIPNDPSFGQLWNMHNTGQSGGTVDADIDGPEAWGNVEPGGSVVVAVIDTGVQYDHPDLAANAWVNQAEKNGVGGVDDDGNGYVDDIYGYDFCTYGGKLRDSNPTDDHGHGTHCSGIIGAVGDNGVGVAGVVWNPKIMAVKFLSSGGSGYDTDAIDSIEYAVLMGARVMSNSWGGGSYSAALEDAIDAANDAGVLFVAAAGNNSTNNDTTPHYPSSYPCQNIVAVLATNYRDSMSSYSNYGLTSVDLGAPGGDSTLPVYSCYRGSSYTTMSGTSMACPHVSGACAYILSICPTMPHLDVKKLVMDTVDVLAVLNGRCVTGGRLNLDRALAETQELCSTVSTGWISFVPPSGIVAPESNMPVEVIFDGLRDPGTYTGYIRVKSNDPYDPNMFVAVTMEVVRPDSFTELFDPCQPIDPCDPNCNDMAYRTLVFRPDGSISCYSCCTMEATGFPIDPAGGTVLELGDDDYAEIILGGGTVKLYGPEYDTIYVGSNGYVSFESGDIARHETADSHFALPRISALFDDLDPSAGGTVSVKQLDDRVAVTFEDVPEYGRANSNSFQIEMRYNGKILVTLLNVDANDGLVGLSNGLGLPRSFADSDMSEYRDCNIIGDLTCDLDVDSSDFAVFAQWWGTQYEGWSVETMRDEFSSVSYSNNDGTEDFAGPWTEVGEADGPGDGVMRVVVKPNTSALRIGDRSSTVHPTITLTRQAGLSGAPGATLSFDYEVGTHASEGTVSVKVSADGNNWDTLVTYDEESGAGFASFDIGAYVSATTMIRFETGGNLQMNLNVDNVEIAYDGDVWYLDPDFTRDFKVDKSDLEVLAEHWLD